MLKTGKQMNDSNGLNTSEIAGASVAGKEVKDQQN